MLLRLPCLLAALFLAGAVYAANDPRPVVGPGASKDDVIKAYGWPNGTSQSGSKEILSYSQGEVVLEDGRVERVNFSPDIPWQAPRPRPAPPTASTRKVPETPIDYWLKDFTAALAEAQRRNMRILALFTGSDWSPASKQLQDEVEFHPDFVNAFAGDFVFLKLDYPRGAPVPATISEEKLALRDRYGVTTYPTILVLSPSGELLGRVDLDAPTPAPSFRERVIDAVRAARSATGRSWLGYVASATEPAAAPAPAATPEAPPETPQPRPPDTAQPVAGSPATPAVQDAGKLVFFALLIGAALVGFFLWRLWRQPRVESGSPMDAIASRIDAVAGGMPLPAEMAGWPKEKLCAVVAALAEFDDYSVVTRPPGGDIDLELRRRGDTKPRVLVCCSPGGAGTVTPRRVRELFGSLAAEGVETGWFVSPVGFTKEAADYAAARRIVLLDTDGLYNLMREVPPVSLPRVLASGDDARGR